MCTVGGLTFKTQKAAEDHVRTMINTIGLCDSVKSKGSVFDKLHDVLMNHPDSYEKLLHMIDIKIVQNKLNQTAKEIHIVKADGSSVDMSWRLCVSGKPKTLRAELLSALRYSIDYQIHEYKEKACLDICSLCGGSTNGLPHIDHVIHFQKLVQDFHCASRLKPPDIFADAPDSSNRRDFHEVDTHYADTWRAYHKRHAILRVLCTSCNLKREKHKTTTPKG